MAKIKVKLAPGKFMFGYKGKQYHANQIFSVDEEDFRLGWMVKLAEPKKPVEPPKEVEPVAAPIFALGGEAPYRV